MSSLLEDLPRDLQHLVLLEWLDPEAVFVVAQTKSAKILESVRTAPRAFRVERRYFLSKKCIDWFHDQNIALQLWTETTFCKFMGERHWRNGKLHRDDDLPAVVRDRWCREWYQNGELHRDGAKPAQIWWSGTRLWYQNGEKHRNNDLPAEITSDMAQYWYRHGKRHRDGDEPAIVRRANGAQEWYKNDLLHRDGDKPAVVWAGGTQWWYQNGRLHRDGCLPAVMKADGTQKWYQHGTEMPK